MLGNSYFLLVTSYPSGTFYDLENCGFPNCEEQFKTWNLPAAPPAGDTRSVMERDEPHGLQLSVQLVRINQ